MAPRSSVRNLRTEQTNGRKSTDPLMHFFFLPPDGAEWVTKRQHPGKRYREDLEKRQHPGRRDEDEDEDEDEQYLDVQRRQHPGKRSTMGHVSENPGILPSELSKRQHPGKRYLVLHSKRQHPGKRQGGDEDGGWGADGDEDLPELEKRQHPGKRFWDRSNPDLATNSPCDVLDPTSCSKSDLLFDFLDINKSHGEHKRQHPGKRLAPEDESVEGE